MKAKLKYFDAASGRELSAAEAHDGKVMRDGVVVRVPWHFADAARNSRAAYGTDAKPRLVDGFGGTVDPAAGLRPGFRILDSDVHGRQRVIDSYAAYERQLANAWRGNAADSIAQTHYESTPPHQADSQPRDERQAAYSTYDAELQQMYRRPL